MPGHDISGQSVNGITGLSAHPHVYPAPALPSFVARPHLWPEILLCILTPDSSPLSKTADHVDQDCCRGCRCAPQARP